MPLFSELIEYKSFMTGYPSIDYYLQGIPRGHFLQFSGRESSYKTTLLQNVIGQLQKRYEDLQFLLVDTEGNIDRSYFEACGGDSDKIVFMQANDDVEVLNAARDFVIENNKKELPCFIGIDSIAGFTSTQEAKKGIEGSTVGVTPRTLNKFFRLTALLLKKQGSTVWFNNQLRDNLSSPYGGTTTPGGHGLKHWSKYMVKMYDLTTGASQIKVGGEVIGHKVAFTVEKCKNSVVYKGFTFSMDVLLGKGFSIEFDLITFSVDYDVIKQAGAFYTLPTGEKAHGKANLRQLLVESPEAVQAVLDGIELVTAP